MKLKQAAIEWITRRFKIPHEAMQMFKAANEISGIDKNLLPTELIPLNAIQISRGLLNFTVIQSRLNWILPYWAEKQYNPNSSSFIPRAHLGLSMNVTHRNWTAVGNPECRVKPIVDPAGLITPFKNGWSIDIWFKVGNEIYFPSKAGVANQKLINDLPVVETKFIFKNFYIKTVAFTHKSTLKIQVNVLNNSEDKNCELIIAVRPFNPEGISLIKDVEYNSINRSFLINKTEEIVFDAEPSLVLYSNFTEGDVAGVFKDKNVQNCFTASCPVGMATAAAVFGMPLEKGVTGTLNMDVALSKQSHNNNIFPLSKHVEYWDNILNWGTTISTPDEKINSLLRSSVTSLLMLCNDDDITPGPFTYNQFWFRDAAYMVYALDKYGYNKLTRPILESFKKHQAKDGYFRSQKGEWDSNGQAVWAIYQHYLLTGDTSFLNENFNSLFEGIKWIDKNRLTAKEHRKKNYYGLLPEGLSAEHLGLVDHYYWDNFWSLAGISSFINICNELKRDTELNYAVKLFEEYKKDTLTSIKNIREKYSIEAIPAGPSRTLDCGMIGSICCSYPLQIFSPDDISVRASLDYIEEKYFIKGLFFQHFIHSGMNIYLTLQVAHAYLLIGDRDKFLAILNNVISVASPTLNYPEAIHPGTFGGVMGDGHHGWASAEIVLAVRDALFYERQNGSINEIIFFSGIPCEWFLSGKKFSISKAPAYSGEISIDVSTEEEIISIKINYIMKKELNEVWKFILPFYCIPANDNNNVLSFRAEEKETIIELKPGKLEFFLKKDFPKAAVI